MGFLILLKVTGEVYPINNGTYNCPLELEGYKVCNLGNKFNLIASETRVKDPEIKACEAIIAAKVEIMIPNIKRLLGII